MVYTRSATYAILSVISVALPPAWPFETTSQSAPSFLKAFLSGVLPQPVPLGSQNPGYVW